MFQEAFDHEARPDNTMAPTFCRSKHSLGIYIRTNQVDRFFFGLGDVV